MTEIGNHPVIHGEVDGHLAAAQPRMGDRRGIGRIKPLQPRNIGREFEDFLVVDVVEHGHTISWQGPAQPPRGFAAIGRHDM